MLFYLDPYIVKSFLFATLVALDFIPKNKGLYLLDRREF
jgi:hypothetical protein